MRKISGIKESSFASPVRKENNMGAMITGIMFISNSYLSLKRIIL